MAPLVRLNNIVKSYKRGKHDVEVLRDVNLGVDSGEFLALMGPSGSGKTTLLNLIGGIDRPSGGEILVEDQPIHRYSSSQLARWRAANIGFVFQFYNLMPMLSAERNVELPLLLTSLSKAQRKRSVQIALELVGLAERAQHKPTELSGGQQQRVGIARALVVDPKLLICDEPTGDLDRKAADEILDLLGELNAEQKKTIVMVTHDAKAAARASRQLFMDKGRLVGVETEMPA